MSVAQLCLTLCGPMDCVARQALLCMGFSRQEYWSGLPFPSPGDLSNPGIKPTSPTLWADSLPSEPPGKPLLMVNVFKEKKKKKKKQKAVEMHVTISIFVFFPFSYLYRLVAGSKGNWGKQILKLPASKSTWCPICLSLIFFIWELLVLKVL